MDRVKRREKMRALVEEWRRSGQSQAAYARRNGMQPQKLSYWKRVLGVKPPAAPAGGGSARTPFVPVRLVDLDGARAAAGTLEIVLGGECRLVVRDGVSRELLRDVLSLLRQGC